MDRVAYLAMSGAQEASSVEAGLANNLANMNTVGFKSDDLDFKSLLLKGSGEPVRVYTKATEYGIDTTEGPLITTNRPLDVAMKGNAWLSVTTPSGSQGYVHTASLVVNSNGMLATSHGDIVNSANGFSITIPPQSDISIDKQGGVNIINNGTTSVIDKLKIMALPEKSIVKSPQGKGLIQVVPQAKNQVRAVSGSNVMPGVLEQSNVSGVETLIKMISISRQYEANLNLISTIKSNDQSDNQLLDVR